MEEEECAASEGQGIDDVGSKKCTNDERRKKIMSMTDDVIRRSRTCWNEVLDAAAVAALIQEAYAIADLAYTAEVAAAWGEKNFPGGIPKEVIEEHEHELAAHGGDFDAMVGQRLDALRAGRLNEERIARLHGSNPEIERLKDLADGMAVSTPTGFYPNGNMSEARPPLRTLYRRTHRAVDKMIYDLVSAGLGIVLTAATAFAIPGLHLSPAHWAPKAGKEHGRPLIDSTDASARHPVLNSDEVADWAKEYFGEIEHPTIVDIVLMIWEFKSSHPEVSWLDIALFKLDLKGAYNLISFKKQFCKLFAVELVGGIVVIFLCGLFGWSATPAAFQVVTRALVFEMGLRLMGRCCMYVDDILGVTLVKNLEKDKTVTADICIDLLGEGAIAHEKTLDTEGGGPRRIDVIGYTLDLDSLRVTLTRRNLLRTVYAFFHVDITAKVPVAAIQRMASYSSRYCLLLPEMRPFSRALYGCITGLSNRRASAPLSPEAKLSVELWRTVLCAIALREERFARPFHTFIPREADTVIQFDASLQGIGVILFDRDRDTGAEVLIGGAAVSLQVWKINEEDSSLQNSAEFMAVIVGLLAVLLRLPNGAGRSILLRGDSITALRWAETGRIRSDFSARAACLFTLLLARTGMRLVGTVHAPAEVNTWCDLLSRRNEHERYRVMNEVIPGARDLALGEHELVQSALRLCSPKAGPLHADSFNEFWKVAGRLVASVSR
jgi:hypothetical protein